MIQKKNKGISLIVLIITIVVIIILATAIIVNLADTNIIGNANEAVVKQDLMSMQDELNMYVADKYADTKGKFRLDKLSANSDKVIYTGEGTVDETSINEILTSLKNSKYEGKVTIVNGIITISDDVDEQIKQWANEVLTQGNTTINGGEFAYNNPVIPVGFKALETTKATWEDKDSDGYPDGWNNGLVITDSNENEYVWIPVDGTNVKYEKWNSSVNASYTVASEQVEDDTLPSGVTSETDQIAKYGGFYVARYEAGLPDEQTTEELMLTKTFTVDDNNRTDIGKAQSKANKIVWNRIDYNNAKIVSEAVVSTNYVQSGLITGTQWDTMLTFLSQEVEVGNEEDDECTSWENYEDKYGYTINGYYRTENKDVVYTNGEYTKEEDGLLFLQTGKFGSVVTEGSPKNLFDVAGNVLEWSTETVIKEGGSNTKVGNKVRRGGSFYEDGTFGVASYRSGYYGDTWTNVNVGFRFVLFIK